MMLGFQNLHQVLFNISQIKSALSTSSVRVTSSSVTKKAEIDVLCNESFMHTLKILQQSDNGKVFSSLPNIKFGPTFKDLQWINYKDINFKFTVGKSVKENDFYISYDRKDFNNVSYKNDVSKLMQSINNKVNGLRIQNVLAELEQYIKSKSNLNETFVSGKNFEENKNSNYCASYSEKNFLQYNTSPLLSNLVGIVTPNTVWSDINKIQKRGFKTRRSVAMEKEAQFELLKSIKSIFRSNKEPMKSEVSGEESQMLSKLLTDNKISSEDKHKLKVSFAEGYMLAANLSKVNNFDKMWLRGFYILRLIITFLFVLWVLNAVLLPFRGSKGRIFPFNLAIPDGEINPEKIGVTFSDVKGAEEVIEELQEIVEFLKNPSKFKNLGGKLPKGVLLVGPPGTGKTLLARAIAGEAQVPFFHASGSDFDQIFVGEGARRVRNLFSSAKIRAPSIIFIDEIDSVGSKRKSTGLHPYANQTINQLLSEMDGFKKNDGVIVIGATNRKEELDPALLRPGRFDVEILVPLPDLEARKQILEYYLSKILSSDIDIERIALATPECTGADLEAIVNHAAIRAATDGAPYVTMEHIEIAREKIKFGPERKYSKISDEDALRTAYHEGGHALVAYFGEAKLLHRVTIVPRSNSLGHTELFPNSEQHHQTKAEFLANMDIMMGGRAAEEIIYGDSRVSAGAASDISKATNLASLMVKKFGMSEKIGVRTMDSSRQSGQVLEDQADTETKRLVQESYERAKSILKKHTKELKLLADALIKYKTLNADEVKAILGASASEKGSKPFVGVVTECDCKA